MRAATHELVARLLADGHTDAVAARELGFSERQFRRHVADLMAELARYAQENAQSLGVLYVIWYQKIWSVARADEGWRPMEDRGSVSANHVDHVHISFVPHPPATTVAPAEGEDGQGASPAGCGTGTPGEGGGSVPVTGGWAPPVAGMRVSSPYGMRRHPVTGVYKLHSGTDYPGLGCGSTIRAAAGGTVTRAGAASGYGSLVTIDHGGGVQTRYAHMYTRDIRVTVGQQVQPGEVVGLMGSSGWSTGCHLHFEVLVNGNFTNPATFLKERGVS